MRRLLQAYTGRYRLPRQNYFVDVHIKRNRLQISFLGKESQTRWDLEHHQGDTFLMNKNFDELAKRAVFTYWSKEASLWRFEEGKSGGIERLYWKYDPDLKLEDQFFVRVSDDWQGDSAS